MACRRPSQKLKSPTTLTRLAFGHEHHEGDAGDALERHRMRAELLVEMEMRAFGQQIEIEVRQHRREAIGSSSSTTSLAEARAQLIALRAVGQTARRTARRRGCGSSSLSWPCSSTTATSAASGRKARTTGDIVLHMPAEIMERIGMPALDDRVSFARERAHDGLPSERERMRSVPASGTRSQSGRCAISYSIS